MALTHIAWLKEPAAPANDAIIRLASGEGSTWPPEALASACRVEFEVAAVLKATMSAGTRSCPSRLPIPFSDRRLEVSLPSVSTTIRCSPPPIRRSCARAVAIAS